MGRYCAAFGCSNNNQKKHCRDKGISFHSFPLHDPDRLQKWLVNLQRKDFTPSAYSTVCSEHFREKDFIYQMYTKTRLLRKDAVPIKRFQKSVGKNQPSVSMIGKKMESRMKAPTHKGKGYKSVTGAREKVCNKCGFVTFSLHVLYNHKYKCKGKLLGEPLFCSYCKRKFNFITLFRSHKKTCVRKALREKLRTNKEKQLKGRRKSVESSSYKYSFSCPICQASFKSKLKFVNHLKQQNCTTQQKSSKNSFSARKSFNNHKGSKVSNIYDKKIYSSVSKHESNLNESEVKEQHCCLWCKNVYPSEKLLFMHFEMNEQCAIAYYQKHCTSMLKKVSSKARKTINVVARKSFSHRKHTEKVYNHKIDSSRTARKTLASSSKRKTYSKSRSSLSNALNQCPVCYEDFPDTFTFYQHQKMMNHWGKATKSISASCKCPFCDKEFLHLKSRNIHVRNHSDRSEKEIKAFLKSCTCSTCSQIFISESAKFQHMKIQHYGDRKFSASGSNTASDNEYSDKHKMSSVPSSVKKKLRQQPNACPVCSKAFSHTVLRNKHFNEVHLKIFECQFCNTKFKSTSSLSNHIQLSHSKGLDCKGCKASFSNELELLQHILKHHPNEDPKLLLPAKSIKNVSSKEKLQGVDDELRKSHSEKISLSSSSIDRNIEYYCDVCNIGYQKLCGLQRHRQSKLHKDTLVKNLDAFHKSLSDLPSSSSPPALPRVIKQPEILTCSECSEEFTNIKDFVPHRLSHFSVQSKYLKINELNPYMCEICSDVLDSHSKVQLHLFWHLQVESTSNKNSSVGTNKNDTIVPDRLSGQHVAKKSFSKASNESLQEVVIGGVAKPLFTCEACNVGFTTKVHYDMHVRKLCKKLKSSKLFSKYSTSRNEMDHKLLDAAENEIVHCKNCNFLFISEAKFEQHKEYCAKCNFESDSEEIINNSDIVKSALTLATAVTGCITCAALFDNISNIEGHLITHQADENSEEVPDVLHCALCNCLFSLSAFKVHKDFCKVPVNIGRKVTASKHIDVLKSALELKCAVAACVFCGLPFDDLEAFSKHLNLHQTNQIQDDPVDKTICNGETSVGVVDFESENSLVDSPTNCLIANLADSIVSDDQEQFDIPYKSLNFTSEYPSDTLIEPENKTSTLHDSEQKDKILGNIKDLRNNFTQLLSLLISDAALMKQLGYGKQIIDKVLINVLLQMGQEPHTDNASEIDSLRKNIQMLLNLCLKEQILQAIGKEKTADEMVIEALNMFKNEDMAVDSD